MRWPWTEPLPRLCYVTDCGSQEESFYRRDLCPMRHPVTKRRLSWQRIVDFYHATLRLATIAKSLKIDDATASAWQRRMRGVLLEKQQFPDGLLPRGVWGLSITHRIARLAASGRTARSM